MPHTLEIGQPSCKSKEGERPLMLHALEIGQPPDSSGACKKEHNSKEIKAQTLEELRRKRAILCKKLRMELQASQPHGTSYWTKLRRKGKVLPT